jgi:hypothetical protein
MQNGPLKMCGLRVFTQPGPVADLAQRPEPTDPKETVGQTVGRLRKRVVQIVERTAFGTVLPNAAFG